MQREDFAFLIVVIALGVWLVVQKYRHRPKCPRCGKPLRGEKKYLGLVQRLPSRCEGCGARVAYTAAGEVVPLEDREHRE
jgi:hypothetical protein